jgi:hypothetical protein
MRALLLSAILAAASAMLVADDHTVLFDEDVDFSSFKTFRLDSGRMKADRPELNFPALMTTLSEVIGSGLKARGLQPVSDAPNLTVDFSVTGVDYAIGPFGRPSIVSGGRGRRGGGAPPDFTEATIVIDMKEAPSGTLVWRGVYHDTEDDAKRFADVLPKDAAVLISEYPPKRRK